MSLYKIVVYFMSTLIVIRDYAFVFFKVIIIMQFFDNKREQLLSCCSKLYKTKLNQYRACVIGLFQ